MAWQKQGRQAAETRAKNKTNCASFLPYLCKCKKRRRQQAACGHFEKFGSATATTAAARAGLRLGAGLGWRTWAWRKEREAGQREMWLGEQHLMSLWDWTDRQTCLGSGHSITGFFPSLPTLPTLLSLSLSFTTMPCAGF